MMKRYTSEGIKAIYGPSRRYLLLLAVLLLAVAGWGGRCDSNDATEIDLVWEDNFEGPAGQLPDSDRWRFDIGTDWGNAQLEYDTDRATNVSLDGEGRLAITAREEVYLGRNYTSGRINTKGLFQNTRGRFEARIRLPVGQGIWPAFWLLGANFEEVGWPDCGEIDIMEYRGQEPGIVHGSLHGPGYSGGEAVTGHYNLPGGQAFNDDFHIFAIEWDANSITYMVDSTPYQTLTRNDLPTSGTWVFDHPFFIILNVAVGGHFVGPPDGTTTFPQTMLVDWVRVYRGLP
jgi:beta-glucanase (GH16 family)